ncbi:hypothetical protein AAHA92_25376 [Salvia divinorum]|uniref:Uncharacterized protein n=1 Tax=Salvia divinorum TaxID=28513 RepID=A0ABD1GAG6_SALDI
MCATYWLTYKVLDILQKVFYRSNPLDDLCHTFRRCLSLALGSRRARNSCCRRLRLTEAAITVLFSHSSGAKFLFDCNIFVVQSLFRPRNATVGTRFGLTLLLFAVELLFTTVSSSGGLGSGCPVPPWLGQPRFPHPEVPGVQDVAIEQGAGRETRLSRLSSFCRRFPLHSVPTHQSSYIALSPDSRCTRELPLFPEQFLDKEWSKPSLSCRCSRAIVAALSLSRRYLPLLTGSFSLFFRCRDAVGLTSVRETSRRRYDDCWAVAASNQNEGYQVRSSFGKCAPSFGYRERKT